MAMNERDKLKNIQHSVQKYLWEGLGAYRIVFSKEPDKEALTDGYWIKVHMLRNAGGILLESVLQIDCCSIKALDPMQVSLKILVENVEDVMNVTGIPLYDCSTPEAVEAILEEDDTQAYMFVVPMEVVELPDDAKQTVRMVAMRYRLHTHRPGMVAL